MPSMRQRRSSATSASPGCRWKTRWRSARGSGCCCPQTRTRSAPWKRPLSGPGRGRGPAPASEAPGGTSCESCGLSRSRRCSWGNRWRSGAKPPRTQPTPARCSPRPLRDRTQRLQKCTDGTATRDLQIQFSKLVQTSDEHINWKKIKSALSDVLPPKAITFSHGSQIQCRMI